ncbi:Protein RarD [bioreactor metagenome]|uniref:Protein RarD n=1 Tax=bioreactor metagenome TaxID=1076179 RepID=A0A645BGB0_9ZZZZ
MRNKPFMLALLGCTLWGFTPIFWKALTGVGAMYTLSTRMLFSLVISAIFFTVTRRWGEIGATMRNKKKFWLTALAGYLVCINWGMFILATQIGRITEASIGGYLVPILMMLSGRVFFKEKLNALEYIAGAFAFAGVLYMIISIGQIPYIALTMAVSFVGYGSIKKLTQLESNVSMAIESIAAAPATLGFVIWAELTGNGAVGVLTGWQWLLLPGAGVVTFVPLYMFGVGVTRLRYAVVGMLQYLCPTIQLLLGIFAYGEAFTAMHLVTFIFIWLAVMCFIAGQQVKHHKEKTKALAESHSMAA